ncbi:lambda exonuclease family protein [Mesorhizobium sp. M4A.F.Ca.ET.090.04.2.1]|uniref:lambda exonuclease family protein n=1 Tax=Mesorhizobium sp. M4A.F.Ca.ET.090.04.2.1 TaxID=2496663 RepID=UPI001FDFB3BE|nr:lambda exonuclease family protein [Mesorhizobium sp. M4A.F.Ca.ET.090.04.2.1]
MGMEIFDCVQGTPEWFECRRGLPTASQFSTVISEGRSDGTMANTLIDALVKSGCSAAQLAAAVKAAKSKNANPAATRSKYMRELAGEILTGELSESYSNAHMERGSDQEDDARRLYAFHTDTEPKLVGFVRNGNAGCSPDSIIGNNGGLEIKSALAHIQIDRLFRNELPSEHKAQVHGNIWLCEREWWDFMSYCPKLPPLIKRVYRDEVYIASIATAVRIFNEELAALVDRVRAYEPEPENSAMRMAG